MPKVLYLFLKEDKHCQLNHKGTLKMNNKPNRPQEPQPPFAYSIQEVTFENTRDSITLAGTLTLPTKQEQSPAIVLIAGMGPNDRDYTMIDHKMFLVIADYLTKKGIAVLRYDKRGVGQSTGTFDTTLTSKEFAQDALAGIAYLKTRDDINHKQIGLVGHSEGGMIAPMVAEHSQDIAFLVLMAGAFATNIDHIIEHIAMQLKADGATDEMITIDRTIRRKLLEIVIQEKDPAIAANQLRKIIDTYLDSLTEDQKKEAETLPFAIKENNAENLIAIFNSPWYRFFFSYDPTSTLKNNTIPTLTINGDLDFIASSKVILPIVTQALKESENSDFTVLELPNMNHWFQTCKTGAMAEYGTIEETISPEVLQLITQWILDRTKRK